MTRHQPDYDLTPSRLRTTYYVSDFSYFGLGSDSRFIHSFASPPPFLWGPTDTSFLFFLLAYALSFRQDIRDRRSHKGDRITCIYY